MLRKPTAVLVIMLAALSLQAQYSKRLWHTYVRPQVGLMYYVGDLKSNALPQNAYNQAALGLHIEQQYKQVFSISAGLTYGKLLGYDTLANDASYRDVRGYGFESRIFDAEIMFRWTFANADKRVTFSSEPAIRPRLLAGIGIMHFNPTVEYKGQTIELRTLGTSGQYLLGNYPQPYSRVALGLKFGGELNVQTGPRTNINFFGYYTFAQTDWIDDVGGTPHIALEDISQSSNPELLREFAYSRNKETIQTPANMRGGKSNDGYWHFGVALSFRASEDAVVRRRRF